MKILDPPLSSVLLASFHLFDIFKMYLAYNVHISIWKCAKDTFNINMNFSWFIFFLDLQSFATLGSIWTLQITLAVHALSTHPKILSVTEKPAASRVQMEWSNQMTERTAPWKVRSVRYIAYWQIKVGVGVLVNEITWNTTVPQTLAQLHISEARHKSYLVIFT